MTKGARAVDVRTRLVPYVDRPEFRVLVLRSDGSMDLLWSEVLFDGRDVGEMAQLEQRKFEIRGWSIDRESLTEPLEFTNF